MDTIQQFDYIVVGCGGVGSAAVYWLSKRAGKRVLGLEQFRLGHGNGGSQDWTRILRMSYSAPEYIPLARDSKEGWLEAERESGMKLVYTTGGLDIAMRGTPGHNCLEKFAKSMEDKNVEFERYEGKSIRNKFPQFAATSKWISLFQKDAGIIDAALANAVHIQLAQRHGATVIENAAVLCLSRDGDLTKVCTTQGDFFCKKVIVTSGAWTNDVLSSLGMKLPVTVTQEQVTYFATPHMKEFTKDRFPVVFLHTGYPAAPYFLPIHGNTGFKTGLDLGGRVVTPQTRTFVPDERRRRKERRYVAEICPKALGPTLYTKTCLYALTPDRHYIMDTCEVAGYSDVIVFVGAAHAYKMAPVLGKILSQMAIDGSTPYDIRSFSLRRPAITDRDYTPCFQLDTAVIEDDVVPSSL
ncbi:monomeric sarcosine oxidase-like [Lytechinus variegatus]|uniref:monomeric sarcosine oxidase-like n=1 Tax=Lytechinus variegatus TaxID=7654 RepID=UPI001BB27EFD|nr:monomeric sarcosine oxidase-like [Lytechinus variegatus]